MLPILYTPQIFTVLRNYQVEILYGILMKVEGLFSDEDHGNRCMSKNNEQK